MIKKKYRSEQFENIKIRYLIKFHKTGCFLVSAQNGETNKIHVFLVFTQAGRIYSRRPLTKNWEEITNAVDCDMISWLVHSAIESDKVPCYDTKDRHDLVYGI